MTGFGFRDDRKTILFLDKLPDKAAEKYLIVELPRMLLNVHDILCRPDLLDEGVRQQSQWAYETISNYSWMILHAQAIIKAYRQNSFASTVDDESIKRLERLFKRPAPVGIDMRNEFTEVPVCVPERYKAVSIPNPRPNTLEEARYHREVEVHFIDYARIDDAVDIYLEYQSTKERAYLAGCLHN